MKGAHTIYCDACLEKWCFNGCNGTGSPGNAEASDKVINNNNRVPIGKKLLFRCSKFGEDHRIEVQQIGWSDWIYTRSGLRVVSRLNPHVLKAWEGWAKRQTHELVTVGDSFAFAA